MRTDAGAEARSLPERDCLDMGISLSAIRVSRGRVPDYKLMFRLHFMNASEESLRLIGRKWVLRDAAGQTRIVEAAEVFNQQPVLRPGDVFSYSGSQDFSPAPPTAMELRLFGTDQANRPFITPPLVFPRKCFALPR